MFLQGRDTSRLHVSQTNCFRFVFFFKYTFVHLKSLHLKLQSETEPMMMMGMIIITLWKKGQIIVLFFLRQTEMMRSFLLNFSRNVSDYESFSQFNLSEKFGFFQKSNFSPGFVVTH